MTNLKWNKCQGDVWCSLGTVNVAHSHFDGMEGVYVIWHGGPNASTVKVGQGLIRDCLVACRTDVAVQHYANLRLFVTWARVDITQRNGVAAYLTKKLKPLAGGAVSSAQDVGVNLPWGAKS